MHRLPKLQNTLLAEPYLTVRSRVARLNPTRTVDGNERHLADQSKLIADGARSKKAIDKVSQCFYFLTTAIFPMRKFFHLSLKQYHGPRLGLVLCWNESFSNIVTLRIFAFAVNSVTTRIGKTMLILLDSGPSIGCRRRLVPPAADKTHS